jgi:hypothetical protein
MILKNKNCRASPFQYLATNLDQANIEFEFFQCTTSEQLLEFIPVAGAAVHMSRQQEYEHSYGYRNLFYITKFSARLYSHEWT